MEPSPNQIEKWHNDPNNWKWGMFYYNKADNRIFVDKNPRWAGITVNFANPKSYLALIAFISFFGFLVYMMNSNKY